MKIAILSNYFIIINTKYKLKYKYKKSIGKEDFRQISGYAGLKKVYDEFKIKDYSKNIDCLIIYPDLEGQYNDLSNRKSQINNMEIYRIL